jgi:DNA gyrase/topoisomerase IV subunit A
MSIDLTTEEIQKITADLVILRKKIQETGATVLSPTPVWDNLRKEIAALNKKLNADTKAKGAAREAAKVALAASEQVPDAPA